ncbi:MAG: hypothetical protein QXG98_00025 [Candidatus Micrarchaeia archaeon]
MEMEDVAEATEVDERRGRKPDFRVMQPVIDANGEKRLKRVGGLWKNVSKNGNTFYTLRIGNLSLLVFPNDSTGENAEMA